jgi:hypothetical protein
MVSEFTVNTIYTTCNFTDPLGPLRSSTAPSDGYDPVVLPRLHSLPVFDYVGWAAYFEQAGYF